MEHFGIKLKKRKYSFVLKRDEFALVNTKPSFTSLFLPQKNAYTDDSHTKYREEWCQEYRKLCLQNFDLNMRYFSQLNREDFNTAVTTFLKIYKGFYEVYNIRDFDGVSGYYIMILDKYKQVYIGKSSNIKKRIHQHWSKTLSFDRTLFPLYAADTSCFSIDFFRALDTTRIFVWEKELLDGIEKQLIENFPKQYIINRIGGDIVLGLETISTRNKLSLK